MFSAPVPKIVINFGRQGGYGGRSARSLAQARGHVDTKTRCSSQLDLALVDLALLFLISRQQLFSMRNTLRHVGTIAD